MIKDKDKHILLAMAGCRCEYCHCNLMGNNYELDHIIPQTLSGISEMSNLVVSCARCNRNKGTRTHYVDPFSRKISALFNPKTMKWEQHFRFVNGEVVGISIEGRATAALLFRPTNNYEAPDLSWGVIEFAKHNEYLYRFLNHLRYLRLQNRFGILHKLIDDPIPDFDISKEDQTIAEHARKLLLLELYFTRSKENDLETGIFYGEKMLKTKSLNNNDIKGMLSILYQQRATIRFNTGDIIRAKIDQRRAVYIYPKECDIKAGIKRFSNQEYFRIYLREISLRHKHMLVDTYGYNVSELLRVSGNISDGNDFRHLSYLADLIITSIVPNWPALETMYMMLTKIIESFGYGVSLDIAKFVTLRRRWWVLHCLLEKEIWLDALRGDLAYWQEVNMYNEIRELFFMINKVRTAMPAENHESVAELLRAYVR
jgi:hypothetical protein